MPHRQNKGPARCALCACCAPWARLWRRLPFVLRWDIRRPRAFDTSEWAEPAPPSLSLSIESELHDGYATFTGLAYIEGEHFQMMNNFVVLRHRATGQVLRLATVMTAAEGDAYGAA